MTLPHFDLRHVHNALASRTAPYGLREQEILSEAAFDDAKREITAWPGYAPTPLVALPGLAASAGVGTLWCKDEGQRFHLKSFKALGGAYAVLRLLQERLAREHGVAEVSARDLVAGKHGSLTKDITVTCATDGNHGRSVAWGAEMFGCRCVIYLHAGVSRTREAEIARFGAEMRRVPGGYDDSVRVAAEEAEHNGWFVISDTSWPGYETVPARVMQGYTIMANEIAQQLPDGARPTHLFIQGGVGGLAAAVAGHFWMIWGDAQPHTIVVEPERADCIYRSVEAGRPTAVEGDVETFMACLAAAEMSPLAWEILRHAADDVIALPDEAAEATMRLLAEGAFGDPPLVAGESGCAAVAGLIAAAGDAAVRDALDLGMDSKVVVIGSEGATDADIYARVVGRSAEEVTGRTA